jgi:uncharacterized protein YecA (UPF0149 family)
MVEDTNYRERIKRHYSMFKKAIEEEKAARQTRRTPSLVGRNEACPCGSGMKYKKCCLVGLQATG